MRRCSSYVLFFALRFDMSLERVGKACFVALFAYCCVYEYYLEV
jgi:hypothetical protein